MTQDKNTILGKNILAATSLIAALLLCNRSFAGVEDIVNNEDMIKYHAVDLKLPEKTKLVHFTSGTGFFVSDNYIVTNEHVVQECKLIKIRGGVKDSYAKIESVDKVTDLALLKTPRSPGRVAKLRGDNMPANVGEHVTVMGYPLERGIKGDYLLKQAVITDTDDIYEGHRRLQFTDSVEKGNSGGPLLDDNGSVVGVVVGKMSFYLADSGVDSKPVKTSSMAISLDSLKEFLKDNGVFYKEDPMHYNYADKLMERKAKDYIVNVHCIKS